MNQSLMSDTRQTVDRFQQLPRVIRWGFFGAVALILFLLWDQYIAPIANDWNAQADRIESQLRVVRDADRLSREVRQLHETIVGVGPVDLGRDVELEQVRLTQAVNSVKDQFSISKDSWGTRTGGTVRRGALAGIPGGDQAQVITGDLRFDAAPEDAAALIAELESLPEISRLTSLTMMKLANRRVSVRLQLESWVLSGPSAAARGGA